MALQFIKDENRTPKILLAAVKQNGLVLQFIKEENRTSGILLAAVKQYGRALQCAGDCARTEMRCVFSKLNRRVRPVDAAR